MVPLQLALEVPHAMQPEAPHAADDEHVAHFAPPVPQLLVLCEEASRHWLVEPTVSQQPVQTEGAQVHLPATSACPTPQTQTPFVQLSHTAHAAPPAPHWLLPPLRMQVLYESQQPLMQVLASQRQLPQLLAAQATQTSTNVDARFEEGIKAAPLHREAAPRHGHSEEIFPSAFVWKCPQRGAAQRLARDHRTARSGR